LDLSLVALVPVAAASGVIFPRRFLLLVVASIVIAVLPNLAFAQQATVTDDAYTSNKKVNRNFGVDGSLSVTATTERGFVKFKLTPNLPAGTVGSYIGNATSNMFVGRVN